MVSGFGHLGLRWLGVEAKGIGIRSTGGFWLQVSKLLTVEHWVHGASAMRKCKEHAIEDLLLIGCFPLLVRFRMLALSLSQPGRNEAQIRNPFCSGKFVSLDI